MTYKSTKLAIYALALFVCFTNAAAAQVNSGKSTLAEQIQGDWYGVMTHQGRSSAISMSFDNQGTMRWEVEGKLEGQRAVKTLISKYVVNGDTVSSLSLIHI